MINQIKQKIRKVKAAYLSNRLKTGLEGKGWQNNDEYIQYLNRQLERSVGKKDSPLRAHTILLITLIAKKIDLTQANVLCVGCRNTAEIDYFTQQSVQKVVGVDLFSENDRIQVMDMHAMTFNNDQFDLVYSAHSLEHSINPEQAILEFLRVLKPGGSIVIEVPIQYEVRGSDLVDFKSAIELIDMFQPHVNEIYWADDHDAKSELNDNGVPVARVGFSIKNNHSLI
jgi:SAM-dependent methyltransferase